jgi:hypothetical protein
MGNVKLSHVENLFIRTPNQGKIQILDEEGPNNYNKVCFTSISHFYVRFVYLFREFLELLSVLISLVLFSLFLAAFFLYLLHLLISFP